MIKFLILFKDYTRRGIEMNSRDSSVIMASRSFKVEPTTITIDGNEVSYISLDRNYTKISI